MSKEQHQRAANSTGRDNRKVFVDAIEQALEKRDRQLAAGHRERKPHRNKRQQVDILRRRMFNTEKLARTQHAALEEMRKKAVEVRKAGGTAKEIAEHEPTPAFVAAFTQTTTSMTTLAEQIRRCVESERKTLETLGGDDLDDVLRAHLPRLAEGMTDADKRMMLLIWFGEDVTAVLLAGVGSSTGGVQ
jgi:hypothetical protein